VNEAIKALDEIFTEKDSAVGAVDRSAGGNNLG
jgi:hypothetical protein